MPDTADVVLTEQRDSIHLECRHCEYQERITFAPAGLTLLRQARIEAFEHCWAEHKIPAYRVGFGVN